MESTESEYVKKSAYVGGYFTAYNGTGRNRLIRLNNDGTLDTAFNVDGGFDYSASDILDYLVASISPATDGSGDLYVVGGFNSYQSTTVGKIVRLNPDGSLN